MMTKPWIPLNLVPGLFKLALEKGKEEAWSNDEQEIRNGIRMVFGSTTQILFQVLDDIPPSPSGKYLYTISRVGHEQS